MKLSLFTALFFISTLSFAEVYQWIDDHGNTHFGDKPPANTNSQPVDIKLQTKPAPTVEKKQPLSASELVEQERQRLIDEVIEQKLAEKEAEKVNKVVKAEKCKEARERLAVLQQDTPIYVDEKGKFRAHWAQDTYQGKRQYISDAQRPAQVDKAYEIIAENCKNPHDNAEHNQVYDDWYNEQHCVAAQAELAHSEKPSSRSSSETLEKKRDAVKKYCP